MSITIGKYEFEGPYHDTASLKDRSGVYAILDHKEGEHYGLLDVGESANVKTRVETHDRKDCWNRNKKADFILRSLLHPKFTAVWSSGDRTGNSRSIQTSLRERIKKRQAGKAVFCQL
jgi:hypothetical protein